MRLGKISCGFKDGVDTKALPLMIELMKYGYEHCDVVILEGIMYD